MEQHCAACLFKSSKAELEVKNWLGKRASASQHELVTNILRKLAAKQGRSWESRPSSGKLQNVAPTGVLNSRRPHSAPVSRPGTGSSFCGSNAHEIEQLDISGAAITTNQLMYGMRDTHPAIYQVAVKAGRAHPVPNLTYKSSWGPGSNFRNDNGSCTTNLTTYQKFNKEVFDKPTLSSELQRTGFVSWAKKNDLYYGDLLSKEATSTINELMEEANIEEREEIIHAFETLHSVVTPDKQLSMSHAQHKGFKTLEGAAPPKPARKVWCPTTIQHKGNSVVSGVDSSRICSCEQKQPGLPKGDKDSKHLEGAHLSHSHSQSKMKPGDKRVRESFNSTIPLDWIGHIHKPHCSNYRQAFCRDPAVPTGYCTQSPKQPVTKNVTMGFGRLLPHCNNSKRALFPVASAFVRKPQIPGDPERNRADTTSRYFYLPRSKTDAFRSAIAASAAIARSKAGAAATSIPLGCKGISIPSNWKSVYSSDYKQFVLDAEESKSIRRAILASTNRPTAPVGALAPKHKV